jgi:hypothetical protein
VATSIRVDNLSLDGNSISALAGHVDIGSELDLNDNAVINCGSLELVTSAHFDITTGSSSLFIDRQANGNAQIMLFTNQGDELDYVVFRLYGKGTVASQTNSESVYLSYTPQSQFELRSYKTGTGTARPLVIYTEANTNQLKLLTDGGIIMAAMKTGTTQANAGAAAGELWADTDDANTVKLGT